MEKAHHSPLKLLNNSLHVFSIKSPNSSSYLSSIRIKTTLIHTLLLSHVYRIARALSKSKTILTKILKDMQLNYLLQNHPLKKSNNSTKSKHRKKFLVGSFRLHYNWGSSAHILPVANDDHLYYDLSWNSTICTNKNQCDDVELDSQLSRYLHWLEEEEKVNNKENSYPSHNSEGHDVHEIDQLADMFIANCHEKFRLEKQESYRRFQEMMARSM